MDWNEDGRKDLILGENDGHVRIYLNTNTDVDPQFSGYSYVQKGGSDYDVGHYSAPYITDWNEDGKKDLLVGCSTGYTYLLLNVNTNADPVFDSADTLKDGSGHLDPGSTVSPVVFDWDNDGRKDVLVGNDNGKIYFYQNKGTNAAPTFDGWEILNVGPGGSTHLDAGSYIRFEVSDWDEDGLWDIVAGYYNSAWNPPAGAVMYHGIHYSYPDIEINSFITPTQADPGENVSGQISLQLGNDGDGDAENFYCGLYISTDDKINKTDDLLVDGRELISLVLAGGTFDVPWASTLAIPSGLVMGDYYIGVLVDENDDVYELDESNNSMAFPIKIGDPPIPDIKIDGDDGPISIPSSKVIDMTISLQPGALNGVTQDWWIVAHKGGGGVFSWVYTIPWHWTNGLQKAHRGPLFALNSYNLRHGTIPQGTWTIEFAVDDPNYFYEKTYMDFIEVSSY